MKFSTCVFSCSVLWRPARKSVGRILHREVLAEGTLTRYLQMSQAKVVSSYQHSVCHTVEVWSYPGVNELHHCIEDLLFHVKDVNEVLFALLHVIVRHSCDIEEEAVKMALRARNSSTGAFKQQSVKQKFSHSFSS